MSYLLSLHDDLLLTEIIHRSLHDYKGYNTMLTLRKVCRKFKAMLSTEEALQHVNFFRAPLVDRYSTNEYSDLVSHCQLVGNAYAVLTFGLSCAFCYNKIAMGIMHLKRVEAYYIEAHYMIAILEFADDTTRESSIEVLQCLLATYSVAYLRHVACSFLIAFDGRYLTLCNLPYVPLPCDENDWCGDRSGQIVCDWDSIWEVNSCSSHCKARQEYENFRLAMGMHLNP